MEINDHHVGIKIILIIKIQMVLFNDFVQALNIISTFVSCRNITESVEDFPASRDR